MREFTKQVSVAGRRPRPLAIDIVESRLRGIRGKEAREELAVHLAETCYECFSVETQFRELINRDPEDIDGILTSLVDLDIKLNHISQHWKGLKRPLREAIRLFDKLYSKTV
jgi:hypothetical protein